MFLVILKFVILEEEVLKLFLNLLLLVVTLSEFRDHAGGIQEAMHLLAQDIEFWRHQ